MSHKNNPILVTKTFLPPLKEYVSYLEKIWDTRWVTNGGPLAIDLEKKLAEYLGVKHVLFTSNGTIALQIPLKVFGITKEVITTPFSYVATTNSIIWEGCKPVFVDIDPKTFCIDATKIEAAITPNTQAIMAVHVYGQPCDVKAIEKIAKKHNLKVIYDGAHAFGVTINDKSVFAYGDVTTLSFHATKLFHTGEGGAMVTNDDEMAKQLKLYRSFGHIGDDYFTVGVNGKNSEIHAAMGLTNLHHVDRIKGMRKKVVTLYEKELQNQDLQMMVKDKGVAYNYSYYPVVFKSEAELLAIKSTLDAEFIFTRRYFYPSLNTLPFVKRQACPVSEDISKRVLCLPLYHDLSLKDAKEITKVIKQTVHTFRSTQKPTKMRFSLSVGIPAHNEAKNITNLLYSIVKQQGKLFTLDKIFVVCDGCTDDTEKKVKDFMKKHPHVRVYNDGKQKGKAQRLNELYTLNSSDFLLTLDADVLLERDCEIENFVKTMIRNKKTRVVAGNIVPLKPHSFVGRMFYANAKMWYETRMAIGTYDHIANLFGSATLLEKNFAKSIQYPLHITADEEYLYVMAKRQQAFNYAKNTRILSHVVQSFNEARLFVYRMSSERFSLSQVIGDDVVKLHKIPTRAKVKGVLKSLLTDPAPVVLSLAFFELLNHYPKIDRLNEIGTWEQITTTKDAIYSSLF